MKRTIKLCLMAAAAVLFIQCGSGNSADYTITKDGLGPLTFTAENVDFGKSYEVKSETFEYEMDDYSETIMTVSKDGQTVAKRVDDYRIEVYSPEFKTANGLHAGMELSEALAIMGPEVSIWNNNDDTYFYFAPAGSTIAVAVEGDAVEGGFDNYYMYPFDLTFDKFDQSAKVESIVISNDVF